MQECIFCKIVQKQLPAFVVYDDEVCMAFLDINPLAPGHTLIIPKKHAENIFDIEENELKHIVEVAKKVAVSMKEKFGAEGVNLFNASGKVAEQSIFHFHLHVVPRKSEDGVNINEWWSTKVRKANKEELEEISQIVKTEVKKEESREEQVKEESENKIERSENQIKYLKKIIEMA